MDSIQKVYKACSCKIKGVIVNCEVEIPPNGTIDPTKFQGLFFLFINSQTKDVCSWNTQKLCKVSARQEKLSNDSAEIGAECNILLRVYVFGRISKTMYSKLTQLRTKRGMGLNLIIFWINVLLD